MPADASGTVPETTLSSAEGVSSASANLQSSTFADIPQVQRYLQKFSNHERKHWFDNEERAPFSKDYVWVTSNLLGSGAFGRVYKCRRRGENEYRFAVKEMIFDVAGAPTSWADILQEVTVMREVQGVGGEHVVHLLDFFHSDCAAWLVLELLPGRSLRALMPMLQRLRPADHQHIVQQIAADVLEVLVRCHGGGIAHCDLKPENLFVNLRDALRLTNVLDWGLATHFKPGGTCTILKGSPDYLAPEVVSGWLRQYRGALPAPVRPDAADMWSLGVLLLEARFGRNPFRVHWWQHITTKQHLGSVRSLHKQWAAFSPAMSWVKRALAPGEVLSFDQLISEILAPAFQATSDTLLQDDKHACCTPVGRLTRHVLEAYLTFI
ncbi:hypothetical protein WJX72_012222 [[Myrmecia] bisecta]|uniref:Protein kinase domain-containing protein n=1 Tax=[Myrmecia] bisecta TaxID=41462 RepID=A0AAW1P262_9CHLO